MEAREGKRPGEAKDGIRVGRGDGGEGPGETTEGKDRGRRRIKGGEGPGEAKDQGRGRTGRGDGWDKGRKSNGWEGPG